MIRGVVLALLLAPAALTHEGPQVKVALDPEGPVTVGTPVEVTATVLVPSYMPRPPVWPDLQIADAITRLPERATRPVTERIGQESWSGIARTWEIVPQRAADYDLGGAEVTVTWADPESNAPVETTVELPGIVITATVPAGAEGIDPFLAATRLGVTATVDGLPEAPKPGDAFTLTLVTSAEGPPAMLLPELAKRIPTPAGLRAYPREPVLADAPPTATRTETVAYVIEASGNYVLPGVSVDWWNTASESRATAKTDPISFAVEGGAAGTAGQHGRVWALALGGLAVAGGLWLALRRRAGPVAPTEGALYRELRRAVRSGSVEAIRQRLVAWREAAGGGVDEGIEGALRGLERGVYGPGPVGDEGELRRRLMQAIKVARSRREVSREVALPPLNMVAGE